MIAAKQYRKQSYRPSPLRITDGKSSPKDHFYPKSKHTVRVIKRHLKNCQYIHTKNHTENLKLEE
jgi:hypothetical protein